MWNSFTGSRIEECKSYQEMDATRNRDKDQMVVKTPTHHGYHDVLKDVKHGGGKVLAKGVVVDELIGKVFKPGPEDYVDFRDVNVMVAVPVSRLMNQLMRWFLG